ncbi:D-alanyl-D-alanine carboxypeptidase [Clostridium sp. FP2]|uniref:D-alanyl-D-alanine carboxypeptidase family protein n=1 Tax=Clostridium TaxID=1485 RepID=UPI0013E97271|nr:MULTISPECIES: D-alanyl-D-alanine carboxypeptidase family protein [Clostridium]MBW9155075.1 D-alanyl-D-alanine carboxypeptidase [Clostridium tagluense]MBZ9624687.1 D-alanyl-D-alanine carboxypeptidase [Clostridium sp. FP2]WLC64521.1 D-alanyl-D-alanine carboxypeptidase [Clostridium tagluense]
MRKLITIIFASFFLLFNVSLAVQALVTPPVASADSVVLMDATTGKILYEKNKNSAYPPASTTKIMTVLLVLERCNLSDVVTVSKNAEMADGSKIYLFEGEKISVKELLYGLILASANDCAVALAEHVSGSTEKFALLMNERANSLGCKNTNFVNPNGLYNVNHKTSAYALALIMQELTKHEEYKKIAITPSYAMASTNKSAEKRPLSNGNRLIQKNDQYYYKDCEGGKTGYTIQSQHSYIAVASRNGQKLIVALVHDSKKTFFPDSIKLLNYGFDNFELFKYFNVNDEVSKVTLDDGTSIPLLASRDFYIVKAKNSTEASTPVIKTEEKNLKPSSIVKGDKISKATITFDKDSYNLDLSSGVNYSKPSSQNNGFLKGDSEKSKSSALLIKYFAFIIAVLIVFFRLSHIRRRKKTKLRKFADNINSKR